MRHQPEIDQNTRFLIQKPVAYAELEENARIALSVLQDDGWKMDRIGLDMQVRVSATATIQTDDNSAAAAKLQAYEYANAVLSRNLQERDVDHWLALATGCIVCAGLNWLGLGAWCGAAAVACVGVWVLVKRHLRRKAAK